MKTGDLIALGLTAAVIGLVASRRAPKVETKPTDPKPDEPLPAATIAPGDEVIVSALALYPSGFPLPVGAAPTVVIGQLVLHVDTVAADTIGGRIIGYESVADGSGPIAPPIPAPVVPRAAIVRKLATPFQATPATTPIVARQFNPRQGDTVFVPVNLLYPNRIVPGLTLSPAQQSDLSKLEALWINVDAFSDDNIQGRILAYRYGGQDFNVTSVAALQTSTPLFPKTFVRARIPLLVGAAPGAHTTVGDRVFVTAWPLFPNGLPVAGDPAKLATIEELVIDVRGGDAGGLPSSIASAKTPGLNLYGDIVGYRIGATYAFDLPPLQSPLFARSFVVRNETIDALMSRYDGTAGFRARLLTNTGGYDLTSPAGRAAYDKMVAEMEYLSQALGVNHGYPPEAKILSDSIAIALQKRAQVG